MKHLEAAAIQDISGNKVTTTQTTDKVALDVSITNASIDLNVSAFTDSIKIGDGSGNTATIEDMGAGIKALDVVVRDIVITHENDSIQIGDGTKLASVTTVGPKNGLDVNILNSLSTTPAPAGATVATFATQSVASSATAIIIFHVAGASPAEFVQKIYLSSSNVGTYTIKQNGTTLYRIRMSPTQFTYTIDLATGSAYGITLASGDTFEIIAENNSPSTGAFDATLQIMEAL